MTEDEEDERWIAKHRRLGKIMIDQTHRAFADVEQGTVADPEDIFEWTTAELMSTRPEGGVNTRWQDIPDADIVLHDHIFSILDAAAFRYFVPAYMAWACRDLGESRSTSLEFLLYHLKLPSEVGARPWKLEKWSFLSPAQCSAICAFLRFIRLVYAGDDAEKALQSYWAQFCEVGAHVE